MLNIEKGRPLHCVETVTGQNITGIILLSEDEIRVDLHSYTDRFHINVEQPIYLVAETGHVVSLHANVYSNGSEPISRRDRPIYHQGFISNVAVVGYDQWTDNNKVKNVSFSVKHTMELLRHKDKIKALGNIRHTKKEDFTIFKDTTNGVTLGSWYAATYGMEFDAPTEIWPVFEIEFDEPLGIDEYIKHVMYYVEFLSFCLGVKLKPDRITINRLSHDEIMAAVEAGTHTGNHEVQYVWPEEKIESHDLSVRGSPARAWNDEELSALRACLVAWVARANAWKKPYAMMMTSFAFKRVISAERLINACRWFEDIPIAKPHNVLSDDDIEAIAAAATKKAEELRQLQNIRERIAGAIKRIKAESAEEQFTRLVAKIEEKFGKGILPENAVTHLKRANEFRGKTAHGHFDSKSDEETLAFSKSTQAMEALCYLLTALDLPISTEGLERVKSNPVVRDYLLSYE